MTFALASLAHPTLHRFACLWSTGSATGLQCISLGSMLQGLVNPNFMHCRAWTAVYASWLHSYLPNATLITRE